MQTTLSVLSFKTRGTKDECAQNTQSELTEHILSCDDVWGSRWRATRQMIYGESSISWGIPIFQISGDSGIYIHLMAVSCKFLGSAIMTGITSRDCKSRQAEPQKDYGENVQAEKIRREQRKKVTLQSILDRVAEVYRPYHVQPKAGTEPE